MLQELDVLWLDLIADCSTWLETTVIHSCACPLATCISKHGACWLACCSLHLSQQFPSSCLQLGFDFAYIAMPSAPPHYSSILSRHMTEDFLCTVKHVKQQGSLPIIVLILWVPGDEYSFQRNGQGFQA